LHGNEATQGKTPLQVDKNSFSPETVFIFDIRDFVIWLIIPLFAFSMVK